MNVSKKMDKSGTELGSEARKILLNVKIGASVKKIRDEFENMHPDGSISNEIIEGVIGAFQRSCDETSSDEDEAAGGQDLEASDLGNYTYFVQIAETEDLLYLYKRRRDFCDWITRKMKDDKKILDRLIFTSTADFYLDGTVKRKNVWFCGKNEPTEDVQTKKDVSSEKVEKVTVWDGRQGPVKAMKRENKEPEFVEHKVVAVEDGNCKSSNVIYCITCNICGHQYIGMTKDTLSIRMSQHRFAIERGASNSGKRKLARESPSKKQKKKKTAAKKGKETIGASTSKGREETMEASTPKGREETMEASTPKGREENVEASTSKGREETMEASTPKGREETMEASTPKGREENVEASTPKGREENVEKEEIVRGIEDHMKDCVDAKYSPSMRWEFLTVTILHMSLIDSANNLNSLETCYIEKYDPAINKNKKSGKASRKS
ncbi:unnamed protein product [Darwinula stevensoni]|uniref:Uncharacterized protein n=1 Tax=Darwinula stevensoni TaxID=69355 RepID=A0A7R9AH91_9CRUS|nr:unnamed protein product [Darwinula stevensoni]CAG0904924.1 unnamed protein product [Darwinula stevensoni]